MYKLGDVLHLGSDRNLILRGGEKPNIGDRVVNEKGKHVGFVSDVFGPVGSPYIAVKADSRNPEELISRTLYANPSSRRGSRRW